VFYVLLITALTNEVRLYARMICFGNHKHFSTLHSGYYSNNAKNW